jgi:hypothetical protein
MGRMRALKFGDHCNGCGILLFLLILIDHAVDAHSLLSMGTLAGSKHRLADYYLIVW